MAESPFLGKIFLWYALLCETHSILITFSDKIEKECKRLYNNDIHGRLKGWESMTSEEKDKISSTEENMVFNLVFSFGMCLQFVYIH